MFASAWASQRRRTIRVARYIYMYIYLKPYIYICMYAYNSWTRTAADRNSERKHQSADDARSRWRCKCGTLVTSVTPAVTAVTAVPHRWRRARAPHLTAPSIASHEDSAHPGCIDLSIRGGGVHLFFPSPPAYNNPSWSALHCPAAQYHVTPSPLPNRPATWISAATAFFCVFTFRRFRAHTAAAHILHAQSGPSCICVCVCIFLWVNDSNVFVILRRNTGRQVGGG